MARSDIKMTRPDIKETVYKIQHGEAQLIKEHSGRIGYWRLEVGGQDVIAVCDRKTHIIINFMSPEYYYGVKEKTQL